MAHSIGWAMIPSTFYDAAMVPLERRHLAEMRRTIVSRAAGDVLELGAGTGVNLAYYDDARVTSLMLTDRVARRDLWRERVPQPLLASTRYADIDAQQLPWPEHTFDTVVATLLFCSVEHPAGAFREIARVLRPGGRFLFIEHVRPDGRWTAPLFDTLAPLWRAVAAGCNLNRRTLTTMRRAGLHPRVDTAAGRGVFLGGVAHPVATTTDGRGARTRG